MAMGRYIPPIHVKKTAIVEKDKFQIDDSYMKQEYIIVQRVYKMLDKTRLNDNIVAALTRLLRDAEEASRK
jgi:hypothetical protein